MLAPPIVIGVSLASSWRFAFVVTGVLGPHNGAIAVVSAAVAELLEMASSMARQTPGVHDCMGKSASVQSSYADAPGDSPPDAWRSLELESSA
jgi:hypothetical protein